jgi:hypothetical protein
MAVLVSGRYSSSLLIRREKPIQANVRSTIQRHCKIWKPVGFSGGSWPGKTQTVLTPVHQCLTTSTLPPWAGAHPLHEAATGGGIDPQRTQPWKRLADGLRRPQRFEQEPASVAIREVSRVEQGLEHQALGRDEPVALARWRPCTCLPPS